MTMFDAVRDFPHALGIVLALVGWTAAAVAQNNLALNRPYTLNLTPNYSSAYAAGDATDLTDGMNWPVISDGSALVAWNERYYNPVVSATIDLGQVRNIGGLSLGGQIFPAFIDAWVSDDNVTWRYGGELLSLSSLQTPLPEAGGDLLRGQPGTSGRIDFRADNLRLSGRYVKFSTYRSGPFLFLDEAKVFEGTQSAVASPYTISGNVEQWSATNKNGAIARVRMLQDLQELSKHAQAGAHAAQIADLRQQVIAADRLTQLTFDPTAGLPYTPLHQQIWSLNGQMNKSGGQADHAIAPAVRYDPLHPFDAVSANLSAQSLDLERGEQRSMAVNISNNTAQAKYAEIEIDWADPRRPPPGSLKLRAVRFTEAQEHTIVGSALVEAERISGNRWRVQLPAGATGQVWLDVDSTHLGKGQYVASLRVTPQGASTMALPLNVNVHRGDIAGNSMELFGWDYLSPADGTLPSSDLNRTNMQRTLKEFGMRSHWINPSALAQDVRFHPRNPDGSFAGDPAFANFNAWLDELASHPQGTDKYYAFLATNVVGETYYSGGIATTDPRYDTAVRSFFTELAEEIDARGLDRGKFVFMPLDEPDGATGSHASAVRFTQLMKQAVPQFKAAVTATYSDVSQVDEDLFAEMDQIIAHLPKIASNPALLRYYRELTKGAGKSLSTYVAADGGHLRSPSNYFRRLGWEAERLGLDGAGVWVAVRADVDNSFDDFSAQGRFELLLAKTDSPEVAPTKMLAAMREGALDFARFKTIRASADRGRDEAALPRALGTWAKRSIQSEIAAALGNSAGIDDIAWRRNTAQNSAFDRPGVLNTLDAVDRFAPKANVRLKDDFGHDAHLNASKWTRHQPAAGGATNVTDLDAAQGVLVARQGEMAMSADSFNLHQGELTLTAKLVSHASGDGHVARIYNADRSQYLEMIYNDRTLLNDRVRLRRADGAGNVQQTLLDSTVSNNLTVRPQWMALNIDATNVELSVLPHTQRTFADFEGPAFTSGQSIHGQGGWTMLSGTSVLTPHSASGYDASFTLQGDRSVVLNGTARRAFDAGTSLGDGTILSWRVRVEDGASSALYFSDNLSAGSTPGGVEFANGTISAFGTTSTPTNLIYKSGAEYMVNLELNFSTDRFKLWVEDEEGRLFDAGDGASYAFYKALSPNELLDDGGVFLVSSGVSILDDVQIASPVSGAPATLVYSGAHGLAGGGLDAVRVALGNQLASAGSQAIWDDMLLSQDDPFVALPSDITPGDADLDGDVDLSDLGALATRYGTSAGAYWHDGDFDLDGDVDLADLGVLATNYGQGAARAFADFQAMNVPEPSAIASLLGMSAVAAAVRARPFARHGPTKGI